MAWGLNPCQTQNSLLSLRPKASFCYGVTLAKEIHFFGNTRTGGVGHTWATLTGLRLLLGMLKGPYHPELNLGQVYTRPRP